MKTYFYFSYIIQGLLDTGNTGSLELSIPGQKVQGCISIFIAIFKHQNKSTLIY